MNDATHTTSKPKTRGKVASKKRNAADTQETGVSNGSDSMSELAKVANAAAAEGGEITGNVLTQPEEAHKASLSRKELLEQKEAAKTVSKAHVGYCSIFTTVFFTVAVFVATVGILIAYRYPFARLNAHLIKSYFFNLQQGFGGGSNDTLDTLAMEVAETVPKYVEVGVERESAKGFATLHAHERRAAFIQVPFLPRVPLSKQPLHVVFKGEKIWVDMSSSLLQLVSDLKEKEMVSCTLSEDVSENWVTEWMTYVEEVNQLLAKPLAVLPHEIIYQVDGSVVVFDALKKLLHSTKKKLNALQSQRGHCTASKHKHHNPKLDASFINQILKSSESASVSEGIAEGEPFLQLPRLMTISSLDDFTKRSSRCLSDEQLLRAETSGSQQESEERWVDAADETVMAPYRCHELFLINVLYEKQFQKYAKAQQKRVDELIKEANASILVGERDDNENEADARDLKYFEATISVYNFAEFENTTGGVLLPFFYFSFSDAANTFEELLFYSSKRNYPYFSREQWDVVAHVLPYNSTVYDQMVEHLQELIVHAFRALPLNAAPSSSPPILPSTEVEDIQRAFSILYARSLEDKNGHTAIHLFDHLFQLATDFSVASPILQGQHLFTWVAPISLKRFEKVYRGSGAFNNLRLIYAFGTAIESSTIGPVWFARKHLCEATGGAEGCIDVTIYGNPEPLKSVAKKILPDWVYNKVEVPLNIPLHFGVPNQPILGKVLNIPASISKFTICDATQFYHKPYGHGVLALNAAHPIGGLRTMDYVCLREMKFGSLEIMEREKAAAQFMFTICKKHIVQLEKAQAAVEILLETEIVEGTSNASLQITKLLEYAVGEEIKIVVRCMLYFNEIIKEI